MTGPDGPHPGIMRSDQALLAEVRALVGTR